MKSTAVFCVFAACAASFTLGCASTTSPASSLHTQTANESPVLLAEFSPALEPWEPVNSGVFYLGAGDTLGQAIFANYVAFVRGHGQYQFASGQPRE